MSDGLIIDQLKKTQILELLQEGKRVDGRQFDEPRKLSIDIGVIPKAEGSARARLGDTEVVAGVKIQPERPFPDTGDKGMLICTAEILPIAHPSAETGPPQPPVVELARVTDRGIRESGMLDMKQLVLEKDKSVIGVFCDNAVTDHDGNLFDVCSYATTAALYARAFSGEGQHVDLSMQEVVAAHHYMSPTRYSYMGAIERRAPKIEGGSFKGTRFEGIVPGKDGYIGASGQHGRQRPLFTEYANLLGRPDIDDPKFATPSSRIEPAEELDSVLLPILEQWNKYDYFDAAMEQGWVAGVVQTSEDLINCPQLEARGYYTEVEHPFIGKIKIPGEIFRLPESPWTMRTSAPLLGQHNKEVYCDEMGYTKRELILMRQQGVI